MTNDEILESQIGSLGGIPSTQPEPVQAAEPEAPKNLGKAKYITKSHEDSDSTPIKTGWIELDRSEFGERSQFYPRDWRFYIKPATVTEIKNWSSIDEERPDQINDALNEIIRSCVKISSDSGTVSWGKINSWDRFFLLTKVRDYTFDKGEQKISFTEPCENCGADVTYELNSNSLVFDLPDQDTIDRHWDSESRMWTIDPKEYDVRGPILRLYVPTLEKDDAIFQWALEKARVGKSPNQTFLKFLPWLLAKTSRDPKVVEKFIFDAETTYNTWGVDMFTFADDVLRNIIVTPSEKLHAICSHCGEEVESDIQFPNGIRGLFSIQSGHKKFGKK